MKPSVSIFFGVVHFTNEWNATCSGLFVSLPLRIVFGFVKRTTIPIFLATLAFAPGAALAQVPIAESVPVSEPADAARLTELFRRLQTLQREVRELRGLAEEQTHQIDRLTKQQQRQYIDLDQRLLALRGAAPEALAQGGSTLAATASPRPSPIRPAPAPPSAPRPTAPAGASAPSERSAYDAAFNLMKERQFPDALQAFNRFVEGYPNGQYTPNAFYWMGELHLAMEEVELARQSFSQVLTLYPDHHKAIDSLYKLGDVYHRLQDHERSLQYLNRVIADYPDSAAAGLARDFKAELARAGAAGSG